jgi:hypothetical protein
MRGPALFSLLLLACPAALAVGRAKAENPVGRYQMIALPNKPGSFDNKVMILDTADGHLWQWWEVPVVGSSVPSSGITYLGKVSPGASSSETAPARRGGAPEPIVPRH